MRGAAITGMGAVTAFGRGIGAVWSRLAEGESGIRRIARLPTADYVPFGGMVPDRDAPEHAANAWALCIELATDAAREAVRRAGLADRGIPAERIALVVGTSLGDPDRPELLLHRIAEAVGDAVGIAGPRLTISTACTSSTNALGLALELLAQGGVDAVVAGGADVLSEMALAGFHALGVLASGPCAPFSEPPGTTLGEGAGFVVLERHAEAPFALLGYGLSSDAFHDTGPDPTGAGAGRAMRSALAHAGVDAAAIDYINAHGTGTAANDPAEWRAIQHVFGARAPALPVSSSKSFLGHGQGAAGVLELVATLLCMEHGAIPPTHGFSTPRPNGPADPVAQRVPRPARCDVALSANAAFGGANCALVVGRRRASGDATSAAVERRPVYVAGLGAVGPHGATLDALAAAAFADAAVSTDPRELRLADLAPSADPRGLDPSTRFLVAATALALADAGAKLRGDARARTGIIAGIERVSPESFWALRRTIDAHGYAGMSASLFARMVVNAPVGTASRLLSIKGALSTVCAGRAGGLVAALYAAELLATRAELDRVIAAGVGERGSESPADGAEGAACALFATTPRAAGRAARLAGWAVAGPGRLADAVERARAAGVELVVGAAAPDGIAARRIDPDRVVGPSAAFGSGLALVIGALAIERGIARRVLVTARGDASADVAIVLEEVPPHAP